MGNFKTVWGLLAFLLAVTGLTAAQGETWSTYLYNGNTGELARVYADGTQQTYALGLPENTFISSRDIAFTTDGNRAAYCAVTYPPGTQDAPGQPIATLYLRDLAAGTNLLEHSLGNAIGCTVGPKSFNANESQIAVGISRYSPGDPNVDTTGPAWQLLVIDAASGNTISALDAGAQPVTDVGLMMEGPMIPDVQSFENNQVVFAAVPYGIGGTPDVIAYRWDVSGSTLAVEPEGAANHFSADALGSEAIWTASNPNLPAAEPAGPVGFFNVVMISENGGEPRVIYHNAEWTLIAAKFINDGQQIAILHFPRFDPNQALGAQPTKWVALDRSGAVTDLHTDVEYSDIAAAPGGYVFLHASYPEPDNFEKVRFALDYYRNGQMRELWASETPTWEIAWAAPVAAPAGLPPFPTFEVGESLG